MLFGVCKNSWKKIQTDGHLPFTCWRMFLPFGSKSASPILAKRKAEVCWVVFRIRCKCRSSLVVFGGVIYQQKTRGTSKGKVQFHLQAKMKYPVPPINMEVWPWKRESIVSFTSKRTMFPPTSLEWGVKLENLGLSFHFALWNWNTHKTRKDRIGWGLEAAPVQLSIQVPV